MRYLYYILIFMLICSVAGAQPSIRSRAAGAVRTKTTNFDNVLSTADTQVQKALDTLDDAFSAFPPLCVSTDNWCMLYEDGLVKIYVAAILQVQYPIVAIALGKLLLENNDYVLLESGDKLLLE